MEHPVRSPDDLGRAIAEFRALRGLTQAELSKASGLNRTYLSNLERGEVPEFVRRYLGLLEILNLKITVSDVSEA